MKYIGIIMALAAGLVGINRYRKHQRLSQCPRPSYAFPPSRGTEVEVYHCTGCWIPATYNGQDEQGHYLCDYHNGNGNYQFIREDVRFRLHLVPKEQAA